ncbi:MAG: zinc-ribbon domain-containing protein [Ruegeria sp.]
MRLTCPNCNAQYEVPDDVIPEEGRDVQCSNCEKTWFQSKHPEAKTEEEEHPAEEADESTGAAALEADAKPASGEPEPSSAEPEPEVGEAAKTVAAPEETPDEPSPRGNVDPAVASILQQEAAREAELRAKEGSGLESQPDLGLDQPSEPQKAPKRPAATETAADAGQKDALPDVETINSSLRTEEPPAEPAPADAAPRKSGGFLRGFALIVIIGIILFLLYGNARQIGEAVPQAEPALQSYVSLIDQARIWLESQAGSATE